MRFNSRADFIEKAKAALLLDHSYRFRPTTAGRPSAVLMLWGFRRESNEPVLLITKRAETLESHKGQYAFPGGAFEPEDELRHGLLTTALRETQEEVGLDEREEIEILGELPTLATPSGFRIHPYVGCLKRPVEEVTLRPSTVEIDFTLWVGISTLMETHRLEKIRFGTGEFETDVFLFDGHRVWGATGGMIQNFFERMDKGASASLLP